jgi:hypothetical protein
MTWHTKLRKALHVGFRYTHSRNLQMSHDGSLAGVALDCLTDRMNHKDCLEIAQQEGWGYGNKGDLTQFPSV